MNTFLRTLFLDGNDVTAPFARDVMLPSLRANSVLRRIVLFDVNGMEEEESVPMLIEAEALVAARR